MSKHGRTDPKDCPEPHGSEKGKHVGGKDNPLPKGAGTRTGRTRPVTGSSGEAGRDGSA